MRRAWWLWIAACEGQVDKGVSDTDVALSGESDPADSRPTDGPRPDSEPQAPADSVEDPVEPPGPTHLVRFIAMGDGGEGNDDQYAVAAAVEQVCAARGCDFALYLGDNFYDDGVHSVDDEQFETKFELPYANLSLPFMVALGNHDFGEIPIQFWRTDYQVEYTARSAKWTMPDHFYTFEQDHAAFIALDTNMIMLGLDWTQNQGRWVDGVLAASQSKTWRVAYGHHPYLSNGEHGNAGNYEGAWYDLTGLVRGDNVRDFFRDHLCYEIDLYLCGHDHNRQWLDPACGVELIVSGAASKTTGFVHRDSNPTLFEDDTTEGFVWVELADELMTVAFYDKAGQLQHTGSVQK